MSRAFTEEQRRRNLPEDYPEELLKQEVYETFQQAPINQNLYVGRPDKPIRKPGWIRAINSVFRTITCRERKSLEDTRICDCGAKLKICGPHDKPCGGMDATVIPCGFDCDCNHDKSCLVRPFT